jgi:hypothetical protein
VRQRKDTGVAWDIVLAVAAVIVLMAAIAVIYWAVTGAPAR